MALAAWRLLAAGGAGVACGRASSGRAVFHLQRGGPSTASSSGRTGGKPRGLEWVDATSKTTCRLRDRNWPLRAARQRDDPFPRVEGGGMEDNANVKQPQAASAVFQLDGNDWGTDGGRLFNVNPAQAIERLRQELELVE
jgi:hypothetical protein